MIRFTPGRKPRSAMWSASSSTVICTSSSVRAFWLSRSSSRPGQAMTMSMPPLSAEICLPCDTPPKITVVFRPSTLASGAMVASICEASSRVGASTRARGRRGGLALAGGGGEPHDERQGERERLAGARAAAAEDVAAGQRVGQRGGLDGEGGGDALCGERCGEGSGHAKIGERSHRERASRGLVGVRRQSNQSGCSGGPPRRGARRFAQPLVRLPSHTGCRGTWLAVVSVTRHDRWQTPG